MIDIRKIRVSVPKGKQKEVQLELIKRGAHWEGHGCNSDGTKWLTEDDNYYYVHENLSLTRSRTADNTYTRCITFKELIEYSHKYVKNYGQL